MFITIVFKVNGFKIKKQQSNIDSMNRYIENQLFDPSISHINTTDGNGNHGQYRRIDRELR